jgi:hypothetical protein
MTVLATVPSQSTYDRLTQSLEWPTAVLASAVTPRWGIGRRELRAPPFL